MGVNKICNNCLKFLTVTKDASTKDAYCLGEKQNGTKLIASSIKSGEDVNRPEWCTIGVDEKDVVEPKTSSTNLQGMSYMERNKYITQHFQPQIKWDDIQEGMKFVIPPIGFQKVKIIQIAKKNDDYFTYKEVTKKGSDVYTYSYTISVTKDSAEYALLVPYRKY